MSTANLYKVTSIEVDKIGYNGYWLTWCYGGKVYSATGDFFIDKKGYLHHSFITPRGKEKEFKVKVKI